ncbi:hypothetical protein Bbelb_056860 [Branchiostoma belcheri]|nr:hypothetical protein Bbelb_056860 [Branchiostoma belcheri]
MGSWRRGQGGVALLWRKSLDYAVHKLDEGNDRVMGIRIRLENGQKLFIFSVYLPHAGEPVEEYRQHMDILRDLQKKYENEGTVIFMGDFNAHIGELGGPRGKGPPSKNGEELTEILEELELISLNLCHLCTGPTETFETKNSDHKSTIDHIMIPREAVSEVLACRVIEEDALNMSDHKPVVATLRNKPVDWKERGEHKGKLDWKSMSGQTENTYKRRVSELLKITVAPTEKSPESIEKELNTITTALKRAAEETIPTKKIKMHQKPYWSTELKEAHQKQIWETVLFNRLKPWLQTRGLPHELQSGGQMGCSNLTVAYLVQEVLNHYRERRSTVYGCFLDTKKAYDTVWIDGMLYKMYREGINGKLWRLIKLMHTGNKFAVRLEGKDSREFETSRGVNQGGVLSLTCFLLANNDVHKELQAQGSGVSIGGIYCGSPALADDICLLAGTRKGLQRMIDTIHQYGMKWRFQFAPTKSQCIVFTQGSGRGHMTESEHRWVMGAAEIPEENTVTHVGVQHSANGTSSFAIETACKKGKGRISTILATGTEGHTPNPLVTKVLYNTITLPSMLHGCELWVPTQTDLAKLERVHRSGVKRMQSMHPQTGTRESLGALGMLPLKAVIDKHKLCFFGRLVNLPGSILAKRVFLLRLYSYIIRRARHANRGFISDVYRVAQEYGLTEYFEKYWLTTEFPSNTVWKRVVKMAVWDKEERNWIASDNGKTRFTRIMEQIPTLTNCGHWLGNYPTTRKPYRRWCT